MDEDVKSEAKQPWAQRSQFHIGHMIATFSLAVTLMTYVGKLETRVSVAESQIAGQAEVDRRQDRDNERTASLLRGQLEKMDVKLDRIIEMRARPR